MLLVLCLLGEAALQLFSPHWTPVLMVRDPDVGHRFRSSWEGDVFSGESGHMIPVRFNRHGVRDRDRPLTKPPGTYRIAFMGDSMVAAQEVEESDTTVRQLERLLRKSHSATPWEVQNWGVSGSSPSQGLLLYRKDVRRYRPDLVLYAYFVGNDFDDVSDSMRGKQIFFRAAADGGLEAMPFSGRRSQVSSWLNLNSRLYVWQKRMFHRATHRGDTALDFHSGDWIFCPEPTPELQESWTITEALLRGWKREVEADGSHFALVVIPSARQVYEDQMAQVAQGALAEGAQLDADYPEQRMSAFCHAEEIAYISLLGVFRAACPAASSKVEDELLYYVHHLNERGHALAAGEIHRFMTEEPMPAGSAPLAAGR